MAFWEIFTTTPINKQLTEPEVNAMEERAKLAQQQLKLVRRYTKARGVALTAEAEIRHVQRLGETITATTLATINKHSGKAIAGARETAKLTTANKINNYAQQLLKSGGKKGEK